MNQCSNTYTNLAHHFSSFWLLVTTDDTRMKASSLKTPTEKNPNKIKRN